ncbi:SH3 domain-containing protein [Streptomyces sp. NPDC051569]|uniref:SH3 domain-containing protein n=1 Tax=Streptomyces sp. NPDC051569 TaxID=3365661 RepID=UPI0037B9D55B
MPLRSLGRSAVALVATTVAAAALATAAPAFATTADDTAPRIESAARPHFKGRVTARTGLLLRDRPTRSSRIVGSVDFGSVVDIFCKTRGDDVEGNDRWYLLADGTWAWASAKYISNIGRAPSWC